MLSHVETLRRLGKLEPHEWKYLNVTNVSYMSYIVCTGNLTESNILFCF